MYISRVLIKIEFANSFYVHITLKTEIDLHWNMTYYFTFVLVALRKKRRQEMSYFGMGNAGWLLIVSGVQYRNSQL